MKRHLPSVADDGWMVAHFEVGEENAALRYVFDESSIRELESMSPVVLYGESGTGKTALSITLGVRWARITHARPLCFATGESFAKDLAAAIEIDDLASFRERYRECKLFILDDLEALADKSAAQEELISTFDCLVEKSSPIIVSCSKLPASIASIQSRLASRLASGYSIGLQRPGPLTIRSLVQSLIETLDPKLDLEDVLAVCNELDEPTANDLKSVVKIATQSKNSSGEVDRELASQLVVQHISGSRLAVSDIAKVVARRLRVRLSQMRGATREANIVRARGLAIFLSRQLTSDSLQQIGRFFGGRDHSTVLHAYRKTDSLLESDAELSKALIDIRTELISQ